MSGDRFRGRRAAPSKTPRSRFVNAVRRTVIAVGLASGLLAGVQPAWAGIEDALKALQAGDVAAAEKDLQVLVKERDPRAQFLLGLYVYGNPDSKMFDLNKAAPLLLDASERGYMPAMIPLAGAYAEGKGVPKSLTDSYKWLAIAERWNAPNAAPLLEQVGARAEARRDREGQGRRRGLHLQDQMISARAALLMALLVAAAPAQAQPADASDVAAPCAPASSPIAPAISPRRRRRCVRSPRAMPMPRPGSARCWSIAGARARPCRCCSTRPNAGSAEGAHRLALVYAQGADGMPRDEARALAAVREGRRGRPSCAPRSMPACSISAARACRATSSRRAPGSRRRRRRTIPMRSMRWAARWTRATGRRWPIRCAPPISIERAAQQGHTFAALRYGLALAEGNGVRKDLVAAQPWLMLRATRRRARGGAGDGRHRGAHARPARQGGAIEKILQTAITWYDAAANAGVAVGAVQARATPISPASASRAIRSRRCSWYSARRATRACPRRSMRSALFLIGGAAGTADPVEGYKWLLLAERSGYPDSQRGAREAGGQDRRRRSQARRGAGRRSSSRSPSGRSTRRRRKLAPPPSIRISHGAGPCLPGPSTARAPGSHGRGLPRRLPADAPGGPFGAARDAPARRPAGRHLRRRPRRRDRPSSR